MKSRLVRIFGLFFLSLLSILVIVALFFPAATAWNLIKDDLQLPQPEFLSLTGISGTLWQGHLFLSFQNHLPVKVNWEIDGFSPLDLALHYRLLVQEADIQLSANLALHAHSLVASQVNGEISGSELSRFSDLNELSMEGVVQLLNINFSADQTWIRSLSGNIEWSGGLIAFQSAAGRISQHLEPVNGKLFLNETRPAIVFTLAGSPVLQAELNQEGWLRLESANLAGLGLNTVVNSFQYEEKLW